MIKGSCWTVGESLWRSVARRFRVLWMRAEAIQRISNGADQDILGAERSRRTAHHPHGLQVVPQRMTRNAGERSKQSPSG